MSKVLKEIESSKKWVVVLTNQHAEIHEGLLGRTITKLPFPDKEIADLICRCFNAHDPLTKQRNELLEACKAQHEAIDRLFAMLIEARKGFFPSKSGQPWEALKQGNTALASAEA